MEFHKKYYPYKTALFYACLSGDSKLVKYMVELDKIDITSKDIFFSLDLYNFND